MRAVFDPNNAVIKTSIVMFSFVELFFAPDRLPLQYNHIKALILRVILSEVEPEDEGAERIHPRASE